MKECPQCHRCYPDGSSSCNEDGKPLLASLPGELLIDGRYQLEQRLGQGSLGIVFKARHAFLKTKHAIKVITPELTGNNPALQLWFRQSALAAAASRHQNIVAVTDFGIIENTTPWLVMELVAGQSLAELLSQQPQMAPGRALEFLSAIAAGVAAAHKKGVTHGNLKPANIMMQEDFSIADLKVLDLGLAKLRRKDWDATLGEQRAAFLNSAFYRAPELWFEDMPDERSDVYSLAAIFYQMLAGVVPIKGDSIDEVRRNVLTQRIPLFESLGIDISLELEAVVFGGLTKDRDDRTPTVEEFVRLVRRAINPADDSELPTSLAMGNEADSSRDSGRWTMNEGPYSEGIRNTHGYESEKSGSTFNDEFAEPFIVRPQSGVTGKLAPPAKLPPTPAASNTGSEPLSEPNKPAPIIDENVQFTVYRPRAVEPEVPYSILVYAHLAERAPDAPANAPDPKEVVEQKAREALGEAFHAFTDTVEDSQQAIPRNGLLTFVPDFPGLTLSPPQHMLLWRGPVHELEFTFTAGRELEGRTIRGSVRVYLGVILLAEINIAISVNTAKARQYANDRGESAPMPTYRKIFASYSHRDEAIVKQFEQLVDAFGDKYLRDVRDIRAGEKWNDRLQELIRDADVFQLFWSKNSMKSQFVKEEWDYALSLNKPNFIRPTFWETPMPEDKQAGLPPAALLELQFKRVPIYIPPPEPAPAGVAIVGSEEPVKVVPPVPTVGLESMPTLAPPPMRSIAPPIVRPPGDEEWKYLQSESVGESTRYPHGYPTSVQSVRHGDSERIEYRRKPYPFWPIVWLALLLLVAGIGLLLWYFLL
jgi:serine/threonine protein kinase